MFGEPGLTAVRVLAAQDQLTVLYGLREMRAALGPKKAQVLDEILA